MKHTCLVKKATNCWKNLVYFNIKVFSYFLNAWWCWHCLYSSFLIFWILLMDPAAPHPVTWPSPGWTSTLGTVGCGTSSRGGVGAFYQHTINVHVTVLMIVAIVRPRCFCCWWGSIWLSALWFAATLALFVPLLLCPHFNGYIRENVASRCVADIHFINVASGSISPHPHARARVCEYTHSDMPHQTTHLHPPQWRAGSVGAWKWLAIWTDFGFPTACQLAVSSSTAVGVHTA